MAVTFGADADTYVAPLGSWHKEAWAERQQREHVKLAMRALEEGGAAVLMERIPAREINYWLMLIRSTCRDRPDQGVQHRRVAGRRGRAQ